MAERERTEREGDAESDRSVAPNHDYRAPSAYRAPDLFTGSTFTAVPDDRAPAADATRAGSDPSRDDTDRRPTMRRVSQHTARTGAHDRATSRPAAAFRSTTSREPRSSYRSLAATSEPPVTETERYRALLGPIAMIFGALAMVAFQFSAGFPWILIALGVAFAIPAYSRGVRPRGASALSRGLTIIGFAILLVAIIIMLTGTGTRAGSGRGADGPIIPVHHVPASGRPSR